jgi:hypothetical protein
MMLRRRVSGPTTSGGAFAGSKKYTTVMEDIHVDVDTALLAADTHLDADDASDEVFAPGWELYGEMSQPGLTDRMSRAVSHVLPKGEDAELYLIGVDVDFEEVEDMLLKAPVAASASVETRMMHSKFAQGLGADLKCVAFLNGTVAAFEPKALMDMFHTAATTVQECFRRHLSRGGLQRKLRVLQKFLKRGLRVEERIMPNRMRTRSRWMWSDPLCSQLKIGRQNGRDDTCETSLDFRNITAISQVPNNGEGVAYAVSGTSGKSKKIISVTVVIEEGGHGLDEPLLALVLKKRSAPLTAKQLVNRVSGGDVGDWFACT